MSKIDVAEFFDTLKAKHATGQATEHSYRPALEKLLKSINPALTVINEPKQITDVGKPDFVIMRDDVPVGYVEAKDVGLDIRKMKGTNKDQFQRYIEGLPNLIYTNGLDFDFYRWDVSGEPSLIDTVTIGDYLMGLQPNPTKYAKLEDLLYDFVAQDRQALTITSAERLAKIMARKGRLMRHNFAKALIKDEDNTSDLAAQYLGFKETLLHDINKENFADIYAETIVYGMFAARYHDPTQENFSRQEALQLLPKSNPFLRKLFTFIAANDLPREIEWTIEELVGVYLATNVKNIMKRWSDSNDKRDPFLHFYETFLKEYNNKKRIERGVWYTPDSVVNFIVRAVDDVLKTEFGEPMGLASTNKIIVDVPTGQTRKVKRKSKKTGKMVDVAVPEMRKEELHRVQILDPATGTGTFLAEVIRQIEPRIKAVDEGGWSNYVEHDLKPRLHGFELLMASYSMCHLKLDMLLTETGYKAPEKPNRLSVWLTNSLEEPQEDVRDLLMARWLSDEAQGANAVKQDKPIMCIIGNPPYNVSSQNMGKHIRDLIKPYKQGLNERKINLDEDYIKFIRFSENLISQNGEGVLAMITNNSFIKGVTHRKMREHLLSTFDRSYVLDLHGDSNQLESSPDGSVDQNVFDIMQGVSINIFVKLPKTLSECEIYNQDIYGKRSTKNTKLLNKTIYDGSFNRLFPSKPYFFFVNHSLAGQEKYKEGFKINIFFENGNTGIQTKRDALCIQANLQKAKELIEDAISFDRDEFISKYSPGPDTSGWHLNNFIEDARLRTTSAERVLYRPFDVRALPYSEKSGGVLGRPRHSTMRHMLSKNNLSLLCGRQNKSGENNDILVTNFMSEMKSAERTIQSYHFPLYLYPDENDLDQTRRVNMDEGIRAEIEKAVMGEHYTPRPDDFDRERAAAGAMGASPRPSSPDAIASPQDEVNTQRPNEVDIFDYIYGVLHCPAYRETYAAFLKIDFPRVPYPSSPQEFWDIAAKGGELRQLHLMEGVTPSQPSVFKGDGDNIVHAINKKSFVTDDDVTGKVFINDTQYFADVPKTAWEFYIGGYQPAQKWLKDRKGDEYNGGKGLSFDDKRHYQKIIHILMETDRIMKTITIDLDS